MVYDIENQIPIWLKVLAFGNNKNMRKIAREIDATDSHLNRVLKSLASHGYIKIKKQGRSLYVEVLNNYEESAQIILSKFDKEVKL